MENSAKIGRLKIIRISEHKNRGYAVKLNYDTASLFLFSSLRMTVPLQFAGTFFFTSAGIVRFGIADDESEPFELGILSRFAK